MKLDKRCNWVELDTGRVVTFREMCAILESEYGFDEFTPVSEVYEYFCESYSVNNFDIQEVC